jgi:hypothetical protein
VQDLWRNTGHFRGNWPTKGRQKLAIGAGNYETHGNQREFSNANGETTGGGHDAASGNKLVPAEKGDGGVYTKALSTIR